MKKDNENFLIFDGQHYDCMIESRNLYYDIPFYLKQAKKYGEPILELACGTGRVTIPIAMESMSIIGLDISKSMLDQARKKAEENKVKVKWIDGNMIDFNLDERFSLIIIPGVSIMTLLDLESIEACLFCAKKHLRKDGKLIFDIFNPDLNILMRDPSIRYPVTEYLNPNAKGTIKITENNIYDKKTQINTVKFYYNIGKEEILNEVKLRMIFPQEIDALLHYNGFKINAKYGNYEEEPFTADSNFQILVCQVDE